MVRFNLKIAFRNIWKNKVFSSINIIGLALSMASCLIIGIYIWQELNYDTFHSKRSNIFRITEEQNQAGTIYSVAVTPGPLAPALQKDFPEIKYATRIGSWSGVLKNGNAKFDIDKMLVTENSFFSIFNFPLAKGNIQTALLSPNEFVISESLAAKYFGKDWANKPDLIGQTFRLNNQTDFKLAAIAKDVPENSSIQFDVLLPLLYLFEADEWSNKWNSNNYHTYLQLNPSTDKAIFEKKIEKKLSTYNPDTKDLLQLQPLQEQYLYSTFDFSTDWGKRSNIKYIQIFTGVGILLLLIACINFINLPTARSLKRSKEVGVRKVNGATRTQLVSQFLVETTLMALIAGFISLIIIKIVQPYIQALTGQVFQIDFSDTSFVVLFFSFILITGIIAGLYPSLVLSAFKPVNVLKKLPATSSGKYFRQWLVVFQFSISLALIICTLFMYQQLRFIQQKDLGFNKEQLVNFRMSGELKQKTALLKKELQKEPTITSIAPATTSMVNVANSSYLEWDGMQESDKFLITQANVDPDFIPVMGMSLIAGKNFSWQQTNDTATYIINETAVKQLGNSTENVIGRKVSFWGNKGTIIGVVKDFHFKSLNTGIEPFIFRYQPQENYYSLFIKTAKGKTNEAIEKVQSLSKSLEPEFPVQFSFVDESINKVYQKDKEVANIILLFAALTIFVGCLGLFGLTVFAAELRIKEIGIRKVLGAGIATITGLLLKDFLKLVVIATMIGIPVAWYASTLWLQNYAYRIDIQWWVFAAAAATVLLIAFLTISFHAVKTAKANPVKSLRID
jgi:putative ABC transport system permease protein